MKFLCGNCRTKYQISDDKVQGRILTIRCKSCDRKMQVRESLVTPQAPVPLAPVLPAEQPTDQTSALATAFKAQMAAQASDAPEPSPTSLAPVPDDLQSAGVEWYVAIDGQQHGPYAYAELVQQVRSRELAGRHYVWHDGMTTWQRVRLLPDLARYLEGAVPPPPVPPPVPGEETTDAEPTALESSLESSLEPPPTDQEPTDLMVRPSLDDTQLDPAVGDPALADAPTGSDTEAFRAVAGGDPDDIELLFERLPREALPAPQESTGVLLDHAGVHEERRRRWTLGLALLVGVFLFGVAWATGWVSIGAPRFQGEVLAERNRGAAQDPGEVGEGDYGRLDRGSPAPQDLDRPNKRRRRRRGRARSRAEEQVVYIEDQAPEAQRTRGAGAAQAEDIGGLEAAAGGVAGVRDSALPDSGVARVEIDRSSFDPAAVGRIIKERRSSIRICYQRSLKSRERLRGKLLVRLVIQPSGRVSRARVRPRRFARSVMGRCVAERMKEWVFPRFSGEAEEVSVPFVLERS